MEGNNMCENKCGSCGVHGMNGCGMRCTGMCGKYAHHLLRKILIIFLMVIVFCVGVQIGEFKSEVRSSRFGDRDMFDQGDNYRMMRGRSIQVETSGIKAQPTTSTTKK